MTVQLQGILFLAGYVVMQGCIALLTEYVINHYKLIEKLGRRTRILRLVIYIMLALIPVFGAYLPPSSFKYHCMMIGNLWFAFFMFYSFFVILFSLIALIRSKSNGKNTSRLIGWSLTIAFIPALIISVYGLVHAQNTKLTTVDVDVDTNGAYTGELKVVLLGDLHLSVNSNLAMTQRMVDLVNAQDPDVVVIAGDIFTSNYQGLRQAERYAELLSQLHARDGVYAVYGNHDVDEDLFLGFAISPLSEAFRSREMEEFFEDAGFITLEDEAMTIADGNICLVGRIDGEKAGDGTRDRMSAEELLSDVDTTLPVIVLQHEPIEYESLAANGADVVLSGHTHAGQIFPGNLIVPYFNENAYGLKFMHGIATVVTSGVGYYGPPIRVGTDSEVMVVNISFS